MQSEKYRRLVDKLMAKTIRHELDWKETAFPERFQVSFPNYSLLLGETKRPEGFLGSMIFGEERPEGLLSAPPPDVTLSIIDMSGNVVDTIYNFEIDAEGRERPYYLKMRDLYRAVRQQVLGADKAVEEILSELGE